MLAVEVNNEDRNGTPAVTSPARKKTKMYTIAGFALGVTLTMGVLLGSFIANHMAESDGVNSKCADDVPTDVASELDAGLNTIEEWFPESSATIRANKADIINQMVSLEDPPINSGLWKVRLFGGNVAPAANNERRMQAVAPSPCVLAVADFFVVLMNWVAGWVKLTIPDGNQFRVSLLEFVSNTKKLSFEAQVAHIFNFVLADGAAEKMTHLWKLINQMFKVGGGPVKFLMKWINEHSVKPWEATKVVIKLAAQLTNWLGKGTARFTATVVLQVMGTPSMIKNAKKTMLVCKRTDKPKDNSTNPEKAT